MVGCSWDPVTYEAVGTSVLPPFPPAISRAGMPWLLALARSPLLGDIRGPVGKQLPLIKGAQQAQIPEHNHCEDSFLLG